MVYQNGLTSEQIKELLLYNSETGLFSWREPRTIQQRRAAGYLDSHGYIRITIKRIKYYAHILAWLYVYGHWPVGQIDHKDKDKTNNRINNLRSVNASLNAYNRKSIARGVTHEKGPRKKKWRAYIGEKRIGRFLTEEEALAARQKALKELLHHESANRD